MTFIYVLIYVWLEWLGLKRKYLLTSAIMIWFSNAITKRKKVSYLGQTLGCDKGEAADPLWCFLLLGLILSKGLKKINVFITCEFVVRMFSKQDILSWQKCQALCFMNLDKMVYQSILLKNLL